MITLFIAVLVYVFGAGIAFNLYGGRKFIPELLAFLIPILGQVLWVGFYNSLNTEEKATVNALYWPVCLPLEIIRLVFWLAYEIVNSIKMLLRTL